MTPRVHLRGWLIAMAFALAAPASASASTPDCPHPPDLDAADFGGPIDNPYFPLKRGTTYKYKGNDGGDAAVEVVTVAHDTRQIEGVPPPSSATSWS